MKRYCNAIFVKLPRGMTADEVSKKMEDLRQKGWRGVIMPTTKKLNKTGQEEIKRLLAKDTYKQGDYIPFFINGKWETKKWGETK